MVRASDAKYDVKVSLKSFYAPKNVEFELVDVPEQKFLSILGQGSPDSDEYGTSIKALYSAAYTLKFACKADGLMDYVVPPLEALWWADDPSVFHTRDKDQWKWRLLILIPDYVPDSIVQSAITKAIEKGTDAADLVKVFTLREGKSFQMLHIGSYANEGPRLKHLHEELMPQEGLTFNGLHHEIYLNDPRKTAPEKLKTILRQPVKSL